MTPSGPPANEPARDARPGDWIEARGLPGHNVTRRGEILEVLGEPGHERYRVRWDERHESVFFPSADGVHVIHPRKRAKR